MNNILDDKNIIFHGIGYNIFSLIGILKYGILSHNKSIEANNPYFCVNTVGSNGYDNICASVSPSINGINNSDCYNKYISNGISFVIRVDENINFTDRSYRNSYNDLCYVKDKIPFSNVIGVMVNEDVLNKKIFDLPLGINKPNMTYSIVVPKKCSHLLNCLYMECNYIADKQLIQQHIYKKDYESVENLVKKYMHAGFSHKFNNPDITLRDVVSNYIIDLPIYDLNGNIIELQTVSKK